MAESQARANIACQSASGYVFHTGLGLGYERESPWGLTVWKGISRCFIGHLSLGWPLFLANLCTGEKHPRIRTFGGFVMYSTGHFWGAQGSGRKGSWGKITYHTKIGMYKLLQIFICGVMPHNYSRGPPFFFFFWFLRAPQLPQDAHLGPTYVVYL